MPAVAAIVLVAPWWRHRARGAARYTLFADSPAAEQAWRGARAVICRTHPSEELWPRSADRGVVILIIYDVRMILSLAFRLIADDKMHPEKIRESQRLAVHAAVCANIQAPYPTPRSRAPAVSPELHNASR